MNVQFIKRGSNAATFGGHLSDDAVNFLRRDPRAGLDLSSVAIVQRFVDAVAPCPWPVSAGSRLNPRSFRPGRTKGSLYSPEERLRRDRSPWTLVQGILAPVQFIVFAVSLLLVMRYLFTGEDYKIATISIVIKTVALYTIMVTGSIWEKEVFGKWLFARGVLLGGRVQHARVGIADRLSERVVFRLGVASPTDDDRDCRLCGLYRQRDAVSPQAARRSPRGA